jgi:hypothetical protein
MLAVSGHYRSSGTLPPLNRCSRPYPSRQLLNDVLQKMYESYYGSHQSFEAGHYRSCHANERGEESADFFCKSREKNSQLRCRSRQPSLHRSSAYRNGLLDVEGARTSPLHLQERLRLALQFSAFRDKKQFSCGKYGLNPTSSASITDFFNFAEKFSMNPRHDFEAFRSSNAAISPFCNKIRYDLGCNRSTSDVRNVGSGMT